MPNVLKYNGNFAQNQVINFNFRGIHTDLTIFQTIPPPSLSKIMGYANILTQIEATNFTGCRYPMYT